MKKSNIIHAGNIFRKYVDLILQADSQHFPQKPEIFFSFLHTFHTPNICIIFFSKYLLFVPKTVIYFPKKFEFGSKKIITLVDT